ncbi:putative Recoverin family protein [Cardiosporidium cionae]|uniref:Recoverin family protein n=1 Tax=Cardiosporidium cionae TaxID=476202 RepID=A0ABQ7JE65_9APIC|nr:putative Recoverin family protein [Cardiosporidium cionae]|eukprot:KAF8822305.1 putative Recoverin family protein [Cardiosporidium cionae]
MNFPPPHFCSPYNECPDISKKLHYSDRELKRLEKTTQFTFQEIKAVYKEFLARSNSRTPTEGGLSSLQLLGIFGLSNAIQYRFASQFVNIFWIHRNPKGIVEVGFREFIQTLSKWTKVLFHLYDKDQKGFILKDDIINFLYSLTKYFIEVEFNLCDVNSEAFKARTVIAHHSEEEAQCVLEGILEDIANLAVSRYHKPDGEELLWCNEFKQWAIDVPGVAEILLG